MQKKIGVGVVVRDDEGGAVAALARVYPGIDNPTVVESLAAWQAVVFCSDLGIQQATFEGNSLIVASALNKECLWPND